ncbi:dolichol-phosphate mannosyltransferase subunit 3 [Lentinula aciculospora]|uniref:Dolichol-phosphate mannosyltransferase subunit 3 n=1 Tax=Lentinula aciculospora TaxID=153920 RepID=A0A9W9DNE7_9AGAR|nr:dolichol-phosphate mannosyltransferase subunit 3 [Lentinula aciculospora]
MTRAQRVATILTSFTALYLLTFFEIFQVPLVEGNVVQEVLPVLPWWLLVSFGSYSLWSLGWGLFTFRDCPEAYEELLVEISQAKNELRSRGVTVD